MNYWNAYKYISDEYAFYDAIPMSDTLALYYEMKYCAYGGFEEEIKNLFAIKLELYDWLRDYTSRWGPSVSNKERFSKEYNNIDSLICVIRTTNDTTSYLKLRAISTAEQLLPIALKMADETEYMPAIYDVFRCYVAIYEPYAMDSTHVAIVERYLDKGVELGFLPCIWKRSIQLLTGTYTAQDTIYGKKLFLQCIDNPNPLPFWRVKLQ